MREGEGIHGGGRGCRGVGREWDWLGRPRLRALTTKTIEDERLTRAALKGGRGHVDIFRSFKSHMHIYMHMYITYMYMDTHIYIYIYIYYSDKQRDNLIDMYVNCNLFRSFYIVNIFMVTLVLVTLPNLT